MTEKDKQVLVTVTNRQSKDFAIEAVEREVTKRDLFVAMLDNWLALPEDQRQIQTARFRQPE